MGGDRVLSSSSSKGEESPVERGVPELSFQGSQRHGYTPGAWIEKAGGMKLSDYNIPTTTSLILIGPKGSGKSSLVNRISRVFDDDIFASERAQVSYNTSVGDGTYFLQEYMIPRFSTSFCLYDTRSLSNDASENLVMMKRWMTEGVRHGKLVFRDSDSWQLRTAVKCKARQIGCCSREKRMVNFVIFVVNAISVLKSMDSADEQAGRYCEMIATTFKSPYLSFKDDKPVVVITHTDLISLSDRARVRLHLGESLGVPPAKQIFDIPESSDLATKLAIVDMLRYSLEHADRNLPCKNWIMDKVHMLYVPACIFLLLVLGIAIISAHMHRAGRAPRPDSHIQWHAIRHLWYAD
ncbi:uncharacterized protein LOC131156199 isoform X2 [Malania oleifera]|uniref:uncharacterized protein LOC131156199 isoform X2 n=1 Tax=Malania oleifera TaxID=397392 RepID=UPI0025AE82AA|nr:uncharacterized protein LOC131156199 isoform X2 [Malania oleifera]